MIPQILNTGGLALVRRASGYRRGTIFIVTSLIVAAMAGMVLVFCQSMSVEAMASANRAASVQASAIERGAEQYILALLSEEKDTLQELSQDSFTGVPVGDGYFWLVRPDYGDSSLPQYGLVDEASKLNINTASYDSLMALAGMSEDIAAAIIDWRDEDSDITASGAENEYYLSLTEPYTCKNAPFETIEELLLARGVTRQWLYGQGQAGDAAAPSLSRTSDNGLFSDLQATHGVFDLLTVYGKEPGTAPDGTPWININDPGQRNQLRDLLRTKLGNSRGDQVVGAMGPSGGRNPSFFNNVFDFYFRTTLTPTEFAQIESSIFASARPANGNWPKQPSRGRINVNTAPREVLLCLPGLDAADVDKLLAQRGSATDASSLAWVPDALGRDKATAVGNGIAGRSYEYSADIVAVSGNGRAYKRCRIVIDVTGTTPQIVYRRDITERGWPMDPQILASLRSGQGPGPGAGVGIQLPGGMAK